MGEFVQRWRGLINCIPIKSILLRIEDWLGEGVYNDSDGHYPERSGIYAGVENEAFLTIGRILNKPELFNAVRKSLDRTYYLWNPMATW